MSKLKNWLVMEWRVTLHSFINGAVFVIPFSTLACFSPKVQSTPYGPLMLSIALTVSSWGLYKVRKKNTYVRPPDYGSAAYKKRRALVTTFALFGPIGLSAIENGSASAALNPEGYWRAEFKESLEDQCQPLKKVIFNAAETVQSTKKNTPWG